MHGERGAMDGVAVQHRVDLRPCREDIAVQSPFAGGAPGALVAAVEVHIHDVSGRHRVVIEA